MLELSEADGQRVVFSDAIVGVILLNAAGEIVHEHKRPAVSDAGLRPEKCAFKVVGVCTFAVDVLIGPSALGIAVERDTTREIFQPVNLGLLLFLLSHSGNTAKHCQHHRQCPHFNSFLSHD